MSHLQIFRPFRPFSGISTMSDSNVATLECPFERTSRQNLRILSIPGDFYLWKFFSAASSSSLLTSFLLCWVLLFSSFAVVYCFLFLECALSTMILFWILSLHSISVPGTFDIFSGGCSIYSYRFFPYWSIKLLFISFENHILVVKFCCVVKLP